MTEHWSNDAREMAVHWIDADLVEEGMRLFEELPRTAVDHVLLATDLHAGNVLRSRREPWLVIDPTRLRTRLYVGYRPDGLYIGAICWDDDPTEIVIGQSADSDRTGEGYQEDRIEVYMGPDFDHGRMIVCAVDPKGMNQAPFWVPMSSTTNGTPAASGRPLSGRIGGSWSSHGVCRRAILTACLR